MTDARFDIDTLRQWLTALLQASGMRDDDAALGAGTLLHADALGIVTHGLARLPTYWSQLRRGVLRPDAQVSGHEAAGLVRIDAKRAFGPFAGARAMQIAQAHLSATRAFVPFVIEGAGHLGALATLVGPVAHSGRIALLMQSTQPVMAPAGSHGAAIGNNPIAFAAPRADGPPLLIDFAASVTALSRVLDAHRENRSIPADWAIDAAGVPTHDTAAALAGALLPMAAHKGLALAMLVQVLAGVLTGSRPDLSEKSAAPGCGAFGLVLDPASIAPDYDSDMQMWIDTYRRSAGAGARLPGERAADALQRSARDGVAVPPGLLAQLREIGLDAGVPLPG
ncbi:Ldh family oxidoreductase [Chitinasiproducens palmae]|nr:Ldh family oxidoreductase [Chitinasiproducens palmae]